MNTDDRLFIFGRIALLEGTGVFCVRGGECIPCQENPEHNPLFVSDALREMLVEQAGKREIPFVYQDEFQVYFAAVSLGEEAYLIGPMNMTMQNRAQFHQFFSKYGIDASREKSLKRFHFSEMLNLVRLASVLLTGTKYTDEDIIKANGLSDFGRRKGEEEKIRFQIRMEEEEIYHHTYMEERKLLDCIREGKVEEAVERSKNMDRDVGKLSAREGGHWRNVCIVGITLSTRAAIEGGVPPFVAYQLSDFYIQKCDECRDTARMIQYRNQAVKELTQEVRKI